MKHGHRLPFLRGRTPTIPERVVAGEFRFRERRLPLFHVKHARWGVHTALVLAVVREHPCTPKKENARGPGVY